MHPLSAEQEIDKIKRKALHGLQPAFFCSEQRQHRPLETLEPGKVSIYCCGPTVYNFAHIGNFRTYVFEDLLCRTLRFFGLDVFQVMNITDVEDKTIRGAVAQGVSLEQFCQPYIDSFFEDLHSLHIVPARVYPKATDYITKMIEMIQVMMDKGAAYRGSDGSIYFAIKSFPAYGRLAHLQTQELQAGASQRLDIDEYDKENICDFALWKAHDPQRDGPIAWDSPFGRGRPGWHIECSCMSTALLGPTIDIHCGGVDNLFPHHENEIAQSECCTGSTFVRLWLHSEHLLVNNRKMSKSLGNFYTLRDLLAQGATGAEVRWSLLGTHYRSQLNFTLESLKSARSSLERISSSICRLQQLPKREVEAQDLPARLQDALHVFASALADDLNISAALAALFDLLRDLNILIDQGHLSCKDGELALSALRCMDSVLGVMDFESQQACIPDEIMSLLQQRQEARAAKQWQLADQLRDAIQAKGYIIEDSPDGPRLKQLKVCHD